MYNESQKNRYIKYKLSRTILPENYLQTQFKYSQKYEEEFGKDLCNFDEKEIKDFYKARNFSSVQTILNINSQLTEYTNWCNSEGLVTDHQNHYSFLEYEDLKECENKTKKMAGYVNREELLSAIQKLENVCDRYLFLGCYEGIKGKDFTDLVNVELKDLDGNILKLKSGKEIIISKELKKCIEQSCNTYVYQTLRREMVLTGNKVIKEKANVMSHSDFRIGRRMYLTFIRLKDIIGLEYCTFNSIYLSGKYNYTKEKYEEARKENKELTLKDFIKENREDIEARYDKIDNVKRFIEHYNQLFNT